MRIIAGTHRGRTIQAPPSLDTRPTTDRVRESIMSSLFSLTGGFEGLSVLDAFSGSGAMGLEAMSRGAQHCVLNDFAAPSRAVIAKNRDSMGYGDGDAEVTSSDILKFGLPHRSRPFDIVFLDPPYNTPARDVLGIVQQAADAGILSEGCTVVYEHGDPVDEGLPAEFGLELLSSKKYGKTRVMYLSPRR